MKDVIGIARGNYPFVRAAGVQTQWPVLPFMPPSMPFGATVCFGRAQGKNARRCRGTLVLADTESQPAAHPARTAGYRGINSIYEAAPPPG
jgi:hypothetical protein